MNMYTAQVIYDDEGKSLVVYRDSLANLTVGIGHKVVEADNLGAGDEISDELCAALFVTDLKTAEEGAWKLWHNLGTRGGPSVLHVLTCMVFQMGLAGVGKFKKMLAALAINDYAEARKEMLDSKWAREDTPERALRLVNSMRGAKA